MKNVLTHTDGQASGTKIWFTVCATLVLAKYALSGLTIFGQTIETFDPGGAAMLLSVFAGTYVARRNVKVGNHAPPPPNQVP